VIYFLAVGLILKEFNVSLKAYLASASVIGLAIGFGSQGLVQDVVTGLTLIFSETLNIEDLVEISGQTGKVESIGLRFTTLINLHGQKIHIPNRTIGIIGRFRNGYIRAYVDIQFTDKTDEKMVVSEVVSIADGMKSQYSSIILKEPVNLGIRTAEKGNWRYLRMKFRLWPGQGHLIEGPFRQRLISAMKRLDPEYADWMVAVVYKTEEGNE
jgi:small conductance mechanosensitive channel